jgi:hypothetical protein
MTGPGAGSSGDPRKRADLGGADAVPDTPSTAKRQGAEPNAAERRLTPRAATATSSGAGIKPVVWIVIAIVVIAVAYFAFGR